MADSQPTPPPHNFSDAKGREWIVALDFAALRRVKDGAQIDLGNVEHLATTWAKLLYEDLKAIDVLWFTLEPALKAADIDRTGFDEAMAGPSLEAATEALGQAILSFTQPRKRGMAERAINGVADGM